MHNSPQHLQMADPSMLRTLAYQVEAIWPLEAPRLRAIPVAPRRVLDLGCGPGVFLAKLHELWPSAYLVGVDLDADHLARIDVPCEARLGDAMAPVADPGTFDLAVCRHVLQAVPDPQRVIVNLAQAVRPGGLVHVVAEDYGLIAFSDPAVDDFWERTAIAFGKRTGTDMRGGRRAAVWMCEAGLTQVRTHWLTLDTQTVDREVFARIWEAWRDGYSDAVSDTLGLPRDETRNEWDRMIRVLRDGPGYAVWHLPVVEGVRAEEGA